METLYTKRHLQSALISGFLAGCILCFFIGGAPKPKISGVAQSSLVPVINVEKETPPPMKFRKTLWSVLDNIDDPVRKDLVGKYTRALVSQQSVDRFPTSVRLAQMMLEAGFSASNPEGSELFQKGKNPFGIRYWRDGYPDRISNWNQRINGYVEISSGKYLSFYSVEDAFAVHGDFVTKGHYAKYVDDNKIVPDWREWIAALRKGGYAEDKRYAAKLTTIIEKYNLYELDILFLYGES